MELLCGYEIIEKLASGGFSTVYKVREYEPPYREFTAKKFKDYTDQAIFEQEVLSLYSTQGIPGTQQFFRAVQDRETLVILTEYIEGEPLKTKVERDGPIPETQAIDAAQTIVNILLTLEKRGIRHLDIKPSNILISHGQYILTDFGIAESTKNARSEVAKTDFSYTAPEKYYGYHTDRSDIYALGVSLHYLLTGALPFSIHAKPNAYKMLCHCCAEYKAPKELSTTLQVLLGDLLKKNSSQRPDLETLQARIERIKPQELNSTAQPKTPKIKTDTPSEEECFARGAKKGIPFAQYRHALILEQEDKIEEAVNWYLEAAHAGFARAQNNLALFYSENDEIQRAISWYKKAADAGNAFSQYNLARLYDGSSNDVEPDQALAIEWLAKSATNGHERAQNLLAIHREDDNQVRAAFKLYQSAAYSGFKAAQYNLGLQYEKGVGAKHEGERDLENARFWYQEAAKQSHNKAKLRLQKLNHNQD